MTFLITAVATLLIFGTRPAGAGEMTTVPATPGASKGVPVYLATPPPGTAPPPAVVLMHGCEGYRNRYAAIADELAAHGYVVAALAANPRRNDCTNPSGSRDEAADARTVLAWLPRGAGADGTRLGLLGYSMGAIAALDLIDPTRDEPAPAGVVAAVAYYPSCRKRTATHVRVPLLILDGGADTWTPPQPCQDLAAAASGIVEIQTYLDATHAFNVDAPDRTTLGHALHFDPAAAADAARRTLDFLDAHLRTSN